MSDDLFLKDRYKCPPNISYEKINCEYWSVNEEECKTFCSLKNVSPQSVNCFVCKERKKLNVTELTVEQKSVNENKPFLKNYGELFRKKFDTTYRQQTQNKYNCKILEKALGTDIAEKIMSYL